MKCLESDSKGREDFHEPGSSKHGQEASRKVEKGVLFKGNDAREPAGRDLQGREDNISFRSLWSVVAGRPWLQQRDPALS